MGNRVYVDTSLFLRAILEKPSLAQDAKNILNRLRSYEVVIPQTVVGEALSQLISKSKPDEVNTHIKKLSGWIQTLTNPRECLPPANKKIYELSVELMALENRIDFSDAVIISHAFYDTDSQYLITTESNVIESVGIDNKSNELVSSGFRSKKLEITDSL